MEGTLELPTLGEIAVSTGRYRRDRREYPEAVRELRGRDFRAYGQQYLEETRIYRTTGRPRFTDKLPNNFSHVGFAHLILPNARSSTRGATRSTAASAATSSCSARARTSLTT